MCKQPALSCGFAIRPGLGTTVGYFSPSPVLHSRWKNETQCRTAVIFLTLVIRFLDHIPTQFWTSSQQTVWTFLAIASYFCALPSYSRGCFWKFSLQCPMLPLKIRDCLHCVIPRESTYLYFIHLLDLFSFFLNKSRSHLYTKKGLIKEYRD